MTLALQKLVTFDEFLQFLETQPENIRYELHDGDIIQMPPPSGKHELIVAFLTILLGIPRVESDCGTNFFSTTPVLVQNVGLTQVSYFFSFRF